MRCLVRDPRELGPERVRVGLILGDLADPSSFRHAMRGVDCVVHLATATRDCPRASIEELNGLATLRLARAAEHAGVSRFLLLSTLGASRHSSARYLRSRALAEEAVTAGSFESTIVASSLVLSPGDRLLTLLERLSWLPAVPIPGTGRARFQPISAEDVASCVLAALEEPATGRFDLAGPDTVTYEELVGAVLRARSRRRRRLHVPARVIRGGLRGLERAVGPTALATSDEVMLLGVSMITERGTADAERLGVRPLRLSAVVADG